MLSERLNVFVVVSFIISEIFSLNLFGSSRAVNQVCADFTHNNEILAFYGDGKYQF